MFDSSSKRRLSQSPILKSIHDKNTAIEMMDYKGELKLVL